MPFLLRYVSGTVLAIIFSFAFPEFHSLRYDPMMITGFIISILTLTVMVAGFIMPRYYERFVPPHRRAEGSEPTVANEPKLQPEELSVSDTLSIGSRERIDDAMDVEK